MTPSSFKLSLEAQIQTILQDYVGEGGIYADPTYYIQTWSNKLGSFDTDQDLPLLAIMATQERQVSQIGRHEIGTSRELWDYTVWVIYFDVDTQSETDGYNRQGYIGQMIKNALENEPTLRGLIVPVNPTSFSGAVNEHVHDSDWTTFSYTNSGQENYWAYAIEANLVVHTSRT